MVGSYQVLFGIHIGAKASLALNTTTTVFEIIASVVVMIITGVYLSKKYKFFSLKPYKLQKQEKA